MSESFQQGMYFGEAELRARQARLDDERKAAEQSSDAARNQDTTAET